MGIFAQPGHDVRLEWGPEGVRRLGPVCAVLIVVDVLSFSTTVDLVLGRGGEVRPLAWRGERVPRPSSVAPLPAGSVLDIPSPNGATLCAAAASTGSRVMTGCLRNARAVARVAVRVAGDGPIGVVPAGERWGVTVTARETGSETGTGLRPCVEDHLGAGAIVNALLALSRSASPEAHLAAIAYRGTDVPSAISGCASGRELAAAGHATDARGRCRCQHGRPTPPRHHPA